MILPDLWVDKYADMLYRYVLVRINDNGIAEDIVQDTLLKALEIWKWGKIPDNPQAWLYKSAKNKAKSAPTISAPRMPTSLNISPRLAPFSAASDRGYFCPKNMMP